MNLPPINPFAGMASVNPQDLRGLQNEREQHRLQGKLEARAAGDGESVPTDPAADRDADGRQGWQRPAPSGKDDPAGAAPVESAPESSRPHSRDPYQERGTHLDLDG
jgi:hypothetical protein